jgi:hypothetical protein
VKRIKRRARRGYKSEAAKNVNIPSYYALLQPNPKWFKTRINRPEVAWILVLAGQLVPGRIFFLRFPKVFNKNRTI